MTFTTPAPYVLSDLAGFRYTIAGYSPLEGYQVVTKIVTDTVAEAEDELFTLLAEHDAAPAAERWQDLYALAYDPYDTNISDAIFRGGQQIR